MTPHPQQHCDHECVCCDYPDDIAPRQRCPRKDCPHDTRSRPAPSPDKPCEGCRFVSPEYFRPTGCVGVCAVMPERIPDLKATISAQARKELFEAIKAERDPHLDYVDWDSIEAAYTRTGGEPR